MENLDEFRGKIRSKKHKLKVSEGMKKAWKTSEKLKNRIL